ncbi:MAG: hypothetical protein ONB48_06695 [candidate division KSB1 bacterium]|nr:hypothetical protein [candidate division KSB1 bacterium]MDZ7273229.1 hypothetical protein [candidate division KSB1 bacterium]MDZ7285331.1 hypothetical protein [candidate division KSB1 bacterium]MDZ7298363.1 hypothetical protein [candidate division KSB1 bacterium]MDZ7349004.1 hypothetical protein [candidate division KSB1 bacterium]
MKIMIYSQDGFGLGHLRRNLNISIQIKKRCPDAAILIIADSPKAPFFRLPPQCDFIKIPTIVKVDTGVWRPDRLAMGYRELLTIRSEIIKNVALSFQPDVFLVDHMPHGALGELAHPLEMLRRHSPHTKIILGLRDILGAPDVIRRQWQNEGAFEAASDFYDAVLIYGCADVFDAVTEYQFPQTLLDRTQYCGYVAREQQVPVLDNNPLQQFFGRTSHGRFILVTGGGGADAAYFMDQFIEAVRHLQPDNGDFAAVVSTGPFMHRDQRRLLRQKAAGLPIIVTQMGQDSIRFLSHADLVISMAGYNTVSEIMRFRKNAIIVPRPGPSLEQTMRTRILTARGLFSSLHPSVLTAAKLAELIRQRLHNGAAMNEAMLPDLNGASRVANFVLSAL